MTENGTGSGKKIAGGAAALALTLAALIVTQWEGTKLDPYLDIVKVKTVCTGETRVEMRRYTALECRALLEKALSADFAPQVYRCVPALAARPNQAAASISLAYNIGSKGFCGSTVARRFNQGDWRGGCNAFLLWVKAGGRVVQGLVNRRRDEVKLCLTGL